MEGINPKWKQIKKGDPFTYTYIDAESKSHTFAGFVAGIDPEIGITIDYLDEDEAKTVGLAVRKDGREHVFCLNKKEETEEEYIRVFNETVDIILEGEYTHRHSPGFSQSSCAFV